MNELTNFDQAKLLKELGFEEEINTYFEETNPWYTAYTYTHINHNAYESQCRISRPTISHALDWCREVKEVWAYPYHYQGSNTWVAICEDLRKNKEVFVSEIHVNYSDTQSAALDAALEYIKTIK